MSPLKRFMDQKVNQRIRDVARLTPISEFHSDDVFIVGYPKSGNTWFQNFVAAVIYGLNPEYAPDSLVQELEPDVHFKRYYKRFQTPMFFMTHHLPRPEYQRVVYLLRDGRDVMVSYFHHLSALQGREINFLRMVQDGDGLNPCKWHEHVEAWLSNPYKAEMITIKYEDLVTDSLAQLQRFCEFVGVERDVAFLENVSAKCSFETMRRKEMQFGWENQMWPKDKFFVRRGIVGSYKDEMPAEVLEAFLQDAGETLRKCGYL